MKVLDSLRDEIDKVDKSLTELFEKRMELVLKVAQYKKENNVPILNEGREEQVIKKNVSYLKDKKFKHSLENFFKDTMTISRSFQGKELFLEENSTEIKEKQLDLDIKNSKTEDIKIGFQGVKGSFSEEALLKYFGDNNKVLNLDNFEDVFLAIQNDDIDYGVVPIENSSTGGISDVYNLLKDYNFSIVGESVIKVNHNLLGIKGTNISTIKEVYSHEQAFYQSSKFLKDHSEWKCIPYKNTAISAKYVENENCGFKAAIGSRRCAEVYGLDIIEKDINFNKDNYTRFIVIGKNLESQYECDKISILLSLPHKSGSLYSILSIFAENNLNMLKIESRPIVGKPWEYYFYIDFEGDLKMDNVKNALEAIKNNSAYFKMLGNYKSDIPF